MEEGEEEELQRTALLRKRQEALRREKKTVVERWELPTLWAGYGKSIPCYQENEKPVKFLRTAIS